MEMCLTHSIQQIPRNHIQTSSSYLHKWEIKSSEVNCLSATFFYYRIGGKTGTHQSRYIYSNGVDADFSTRLMNADKPSVNWTLI